MTAVAEAFAKNLPRTLTAEDRAEIEDVLDGARAWELGDIPPEVFARIGTMESPAGIVSAAYTRHVALLTTARSDGRRNSLRRAIDELLRFSGLRLTNFGAFDAEELRNVTVRYTQEHW